MSDETEKIISIRRLGQAIGRSHTAARKWIEHEEWPFPRVPPWQLADVPAMRLWAADTLREDRGDLTPPVGFWERSPDFDPLLIPRDATFYPMATRDVTKLPPPLVTPMELDVIEGKRALPASLVAEYVRWAVRLKVSIADDLNYFAQCVAGYKPQEVERRLRSLVYDKLLWHGERCRDVADKQDGITRDDDGKPVRRRKAGKR